VYPTDTARAFIGTSNGGVWTSDGKRLVFSRSADKGNLFWQPADGSAEAEQLTQRDTRQIPTSLTPDGNRVIFHEAASNLGLRDIGIVSLTGNLLLQSLQASGLVTLWAQAGSILSGAAGTNVTATNLELSAATGIGTALQPLTTQVQRLEAAGGTGGVFIANLGSLQVGGISPSLLNLTGLSATLSGPVAVSTTVDLTLSEAVQSASGPIGLSAGGNLIALVGGDITSTSGAVTLTADSDGVGGGAIHLADGTVVNAGSGPIALLATGDITLGRLVLNVLLFAPLGWLLTRRAGWRWSADMFHGR
jgi:hypothetical protein